MTLPDSQLRERMRARRRALPAPLRIAAAERIAERLVSLPAMPTTGRIAGYWAVDGEISLHALLLRLPTTLSYCLPVVQNDHVMRFAAWRPGQPLASNRFGIPEPDVAADLLLDAHELDFIVAPLVAFDQTGNRVGMGSGWYDRTFAFRQTAMTPPLVGVAYALQQVERIDARPWDIRMDAICTESATVIAETSLPT